MATAVASLPPTALRRLAAYMVTHGYCTEDTAVSVIVTHAISLLEEHRVCQRHWTRRTQARGERAARHALVERVLALGVSQAALARTLGVSCATVSRWHTQARGISPEHQQVLAALAATLEQAET